MDAVLNVVGTIGAIWLAISILLALAWALGGRKIFRRRPAQPAVSVFDSTDTVSKVITELNRRNRRNGGA